MLGSLLGSGGGFVIVPVLTLVFHLDIRLAIGTSIVAVAATSSAGAARNVTESITNLRVATFLALATTVGAVTGALAGRRVRRPLPVRPFRDRPWRLGSPDDPRSTHAAGVDRVAVREPVPAWRASGLATERRGPVAQARLADRLRAPFGLLRRGGRLEVPYVVANTGLGLGLMYLAGTLSGLLGIGSGVLKVPAMDLAMHIPMKVSTATSNLLIGLTAAASAVVYFARGDIDPLIAGPVALGVLLGATQGSKLLARYPRRATPGALCGRLAVVAVQMLWKGIG